MRIVRNKPIAVLVMAIIIMHLMAFSVLAADMEKLNQEFDQQQQQQTVDKPNLAVEFVKLVVVLGLIVGAAWSIIRLFSRQVNSRMQGTWLHVVDEVALGQNRGILLCEVGERIFAVGVTHHNISLLFEVSHPKLLEEISMGMENERAAVPADPWQKFWNGLIGRWKTVAPYRPPQAKKADFQSLMEEQVKRIQTLSSNNNGGSQHNAHKNPDA